MSTTVDAQPQPGLHVACFGECMLELNGPAFGTMQQTFGGDTLNTAVYLARCGRMLSQTQTQTQTQAQAPAHPNPQPLAVSYASAVGDDTLSEQLTQRWSAEGLQLGCVRRIPGKLPGLYQISLAANGERQFSYWRGQSAARDYFDAPATPLEQQAGGLAALHFSGISLAVLPAAGRERLLAVAQALRARGAWVVFDNNYRPKLWASSAEARTWFGRALDVCSLALLTLDDELALHGCADADLQTARTLDIACPEVVVKRGSLSTLLRLSNAAGPMRQHVHAVPTDAVPQVVDTTAAGDSFAGAYLAARLAGRTPQAAAAAGNRLAARVIQHRGALMPLAAMQDWHCD